MDRYFLGCYMQQKHGVVPAFDELLALIKPARIIELGTGAGGLSVFLSIYSHSAGCQFHTYDNRARNVKLLDILQVDRRICDIFTEGEEIRKIAGATGTTLLLCDNGHKAREVNMLASALKVGDVIMAHDYFPERPPPGTPDSCEITDSAISEACLKYNIRPFLDYFFTPLRWFCGRKEPA